MTFQGKTKVVAKAKKIDNLLLMITSPSSCIILLGVSPLKPRGWIEKDRASTTRPANQHFTGTRANTHTFECRASGYSPVRRCAEALKWSPGGHCARLAPSLGSTDMIGCISGIVARPDGTRSWAAERSTAQISHRTTARFGPNEGSRGTGSRWKSCWFEAATQKRQPGATFS